MEFDHATTGICRKVLRIKVCAGECPDSGLQSAAKNARVHAGAGLRCNFAIGDTCWLSESCTTSCYYHYEVVQGFPVLFCCSPISVSWRDTAVFSSIAALPEITTRTSLVLPQDCLCNLSHYSSHCNRLCVSIAPLKVCCPSKPLLKLTLRK